MIVAEFPRHLLTIEEFEVFPGYDSGRFELQEGVVIARPRSDSLRTPVVLDLVATLNDQLPAQWRALSAVEVVTGSAHPATMRVPDIIVVRAETAAAEPRRLAAGEVLVAVEVIALGSRTMDTVMKPIEYARAGIPHYWVLDLAEPSSVTTYRLGDNSQYQMGQPTSTALATTEPFPLTIELTELLSTQKRRVDQ